MVLETRELHLLTSLSSEGIGVRQGQFALSCLEVPMLITVYHYFTVLCLGFIFLKITENEEEDF